MAPTYFVGTRDRLRHRLFGSSAFILVYALSDIKSPKKQLRLDALVRRDALDLEFRIEASLGMAELAGMLSVAPGDIVSGFWPMRSEVDVRPLMFALREKGAILVLPAILDKTTIVFRELVRGVELIDMGFGTYGPGPEAKVIEPGMMLVPLAAFDSHGHRIGYGAGYYDRAIARLAERGMKPRLIGIAFDCQRIERVPDEPHDVPLDAILTESGLRAFPF
jgi:5-formyltetrahydrofolate cyclo-ligase